MFEVLENGEEKRISCFKYVIKISYNPDTKQTETDIFSETSDDEFWKYLNNLVIFM